MTQELQPDELAALMGPRLLVCIVCDEPTEATCPICGYSVCNVCQGEHENSSSCEVVFD